mmetsp:Transcript_36504/g.145975  ORF Transcript_36504/g.145975 Transcript_36504/m.145975 type:complete len:100 (-) Transcript_36504:2702-3001(-)
MPGSSEAAAVVAAQEVQQLSARMELVAMVPTSSEVVAVAVQEVQQLLARMELVATVPTSSEVVAVAVREVQQLLARMVSWEVLAAATRPGAVVGEPLST